MVQAKLHGDCSYIEVNISDFHVIQSFGVEFCEQDMKLRKWDVGFTEGKEEWVLVSACQNHRELGGVDEKKGN